MVLDHSVYSGRDISGIVGAYRVGGVSVGCLRSRSLENPKSNLATEIYADDGRLLGSFFIQNRSYVDYEELSPALVAALVATEDARFYGHSGIDFISLARVAVKTLAFGNRSQGEAAPSRSSSPKTSFRATPPFTAIRSCAADGWSSPSSRSG